MSTKSQLSRAQLLREEARSRKREEERFLDDLQQAVDRDLWRRLNLGSTERAEANLKAARNPAVRPASGEIEMDETVVQANQMLALCRERDELQTSRPDGCTCLATGFRLHSHDVCSCAEGQAIDEKLAAFREARDADVRTDRVVIFREGLGRRLEDLTLDSFPATTPAGRKLLAGVRQRVADPKQPSFWLVGPNGVGKTGLAKAIAEELLATGAARDAALLSVPDLLHRLKSTYDGQHGSEYELVEAFRDVDALVLDDFGAERVTESGWAAERLFLVVNHRYDHLLQTIVTSNLTPSELGKHLGDQGPRIVWRLLEMCDQQVLSLAGMPNLRAPKAAPKLEVVANG